ncbi:hypothetical protein [Aureimonas sp. Leaf324]|uniref:hypothetical protein n=1 Tax=Aureimonas sp. Leaf324 TaxID=1736336 RepID=UPI0006F4B14B|nr:hypothetical protein [Aureimonas sp. Leaf324]KQQ81946.1 hypothetical protein ASF65_07780 [Aureimonas sp. Leaf324]
MRPVLVSPPAQRPIEPEAVIANVETLADAAPSVIGVLIDAAVSHLDGWSGTLGRCLVEQTWKVTYGSPACRLLIPFRDLIAVTSVKVAGQDIPTASFTVRDCAEGHRLSPIAAWPIGEVTIEFTAGYGGAEQVPAAIKQAITLMVTNLYAQASEDGRSRSFTVDGAFTEAFNSPEQQGAQSNAAVRMLLAPFQLIAI